MSVTGKSVAGLFQGVQPRTAGFNSIDTGALNPETLLGTDVLMFIGGGSAGTAGGIKVTTFAVLLFVIVTEVRGDPSVTAFGRRIPREVQRQALSVALLAVAVVVGATALLLLLTHFTLDQVLFEVVSAFSTVGLSTGITDAGRHRRPAAADGPDVPGTARTHHAGLGAGPAVPPAAVRPARRNAPSSAEPAAPPDDHGAPMPDLFSPRRRPDRPPAGRDRQRRGDRPGPLRQRAGARADGVAAPRCSASTRTSTSCRTLSSRLTHCVRADSTNEDGPAPARGARVRPGRGRRSARTSRRACSPRRCSSSIGVTDIWAKAISEPHGRILDQLGIAHVVFPEYEMGRRVAHLVKGRMLDFIQFEPDYAMVKTEPPALLLGVPLGRSGVRRRHGITVVGVKQPWRHVRARDRRDRPVRGRHDHHLGAAVRGGAVQRAALTGPLRRAGARRRTGVPASRRPRPTGRGSPVRRPARAPRTARRCAG